LSPSVIAGLSFFCAICAATLGAFLRTRLPEQHLLDDSRDVLKLVIGLIATLSALVLGLLIAAAQGSYNSQAEALQKMAANAVQVDRFLVLYGPETAEARRLLRQTAVELDQRVWSAHGINREGIRSLTEATTLIALYKELTNLDPKTRAQRFALDRVLQRQDELGLTRLLLYEQGSRTIAPAFLVLLVFWICVLFLGFGVLAPLNSTLATIMLVGALSVSGTIFLILELNSPYQGLIQLSDRPLREALSQMDALPH